MERLCAYCGSNPPSHSEHVFPASLGGEDLYMDCVCDQCNSDFSKLETQLIAKSPIAMMKSSAEVEGYRRKQHWRFAIKYPEMFLLDTAKHAIFEVGLHSKFHPYLRTQILRIDGDIHVLSSSKDEAEDFTALMLKWRSVNYPVCTRLPSTNDDLFEVTSFERLGDSFSRHISMVDSVKDAVVLYLLSGGHEDSIAADFEPRLFIDDQRRLLMRARTVEDGLLLVEAILSKMDAGLPITSLNGYVPPKSEWIKLRMQFDPIKAQRAATKIALNALMYYMPRTQYDPMLAPAKTYVLNGSPFNGGLADKNEALDENATTHQVVFMQHPEGVMVRLMFFSHMAYTFAIPGLRILTPGEGCGLVVDYEKKKNSFLMSLEEIASHRMKELGWITDIESQ